MNQGMRRVFGAALVAAVLAASAVSQDKAAKIQELVGLYHAERQFNGSVLVAENSKVIFKKGFGPANMEWNIPNQPDTKFRLGSITKQFTATLVLQLVEQGKLKLDGKITDYLPDYPRKTGDRITIHHLLNHTSGIPSPRFSSEHSRDPYKPAELATKFFADKELEFDPGSQFRYNNSGYHLLGVIIEKVTGTTYEKALAKHVFGPLDLNNTGYDLHKTLLEKRATGYQKTMAGYETAPYLDMTIPYAAGSLYSTVEDLYLWDQALYTDKLLSPKMKALMFQPGMNNYAYGWGVRKAPEGQPGAGATLISHGGSINGFDTLIVRIPDHRHLIVLFNNTGGTRLNDISLGIRNILYGRPYQKPKKSLAEALGRTVAEKGVTAAITQYRELKTRPDDYDLREGELNGIGYSLLRDGRIKDAIEIFQLNVEAYPKSSNVYDSLAEAHAEAGEHETAIKLYAKSLELNPRNAGTIERLKQLSEKLKRP